MRPYIPDRDKNNVNHGPHAQTSETEQLSNALSPLAQIKPIRPKSSQEDGQNETSRPSISRSPIARQHFMEGSPAETVHVRAHGTIAFEARLGRGRLLDVTTGIDAITGAIA